MAKDKKPVEYLLDDTLTTMPKSDAIEMSVQVTESLIKQYGMNPEDFLVPWEDFPWLQNRLFRRRD